jgi:menaquinone-specific isochorismate synthase
MSLEVVIRRIAPFAPENYDYLFARKNKSLFGIGTAIRLHAKGETRIEDLNRQWTELLSQAHIVNESGVDSVSLSAFVSITFAADSNFESVLIVPQRLIVSDQDQTFEVLVSDSRSVAPATQVQCGHFASGAKSAEVFKANVSRAIEKISQGDLEKVVLSRELTMDLPGEPDLTEPLTRLRRRYPDCWTYKVESVFGASPELLIRGNRGEVSARVLAGTAGRGTDPDVDRAISSSLTHSNKNIHEHAYAVKSMLDELSPFCDFVEADSEPFSLALPDLWHLATDVRGNLKPEVTLLDVVSRLHPTAAVAGTPRQVATNLIAELEGSDRGGYAGPVGWISADGSGELAIALRGGVIETTDSGTKIRAIAGCGIVAESDPEAELAETELKLRAVRYAFED